MWAVTPPSDALLGGMLLMAGLELSSGPPPPCCSDGGVNDSSNTLQPGRAAQLTSSTTIDAKVKGHNGQRRTKCFLGKASEKWEFPRGVLCTESNVFPGNFI